MGIEIATSADMAEIKEIMHGWFDKTYGLPFTGVLIRWLAPR